MRNFLILLLIATVSISLIYLQNEDTTIPSLTFYTIGEIEGVEGFIWGNGKELHITNGEAIFTYNIDTREAQAIVKPSAKYVLGRDEHGEVIYCSWINNDIMLPEEKATLILIHNQNKEVIANIPLHETVRPISCSTKQLITQDNYHGSPERTYLVTVENALIKEIKLEDEDSIKITGDTQTTLEIKNKRYTIDLPNNFTDSKISQQGTVALLTNQGTLIITGPTGN